MPTLTRLGPIEDRLATDETAISTLQAEVANIQTNGVPIGNAVIAVSEDGTNVGSRPRLNLTGQSGVQIAVTDDPARNQIDVTLQA